MDDSTDGRSKGLMLGEQLLDLLDSVCDGLLAGGIPRATLNRLANAAERSAMISFADPKLQDVPDRVEVRRNMKPTNWSSSIKEWPNPLSAWSAGGVQSIKIKTFPNTPKSPSSRSPGAIAIGAIQVPVMTVWPAQAAFRAATIHWQAR